MIGSNVSGSPASFWELADVFFFLVGAVCGIVC